MDETIGTGKARGRGAASVARGWNLRGLSAVSFAHAVSDFFSGVVPFAIFLVLTRDHVSAAYQGALLFIWYLTSSLVQPLFGACTDRHGRWWFLPASVALTAVSVCLAAATSSLWALAACLVAGGLGSSIMHPEAGKYSAMLSGSRRASGISIFQIGGQLGFSAGPVAIAFLYARFATDGSLLLLAPAALAVAFIFAVMPGIDRSAVSLHKARRAHAAAHTPVDRIGVSLLVASTALRYFVSAAFVTYLPNLLVGRGMSIPQAGAVVTAFLFVASFGLLAGGSLSDRFGAVRVSILALVLAVPFLFAFFLVPAPLGIASLLAGSVLLAVQNAPGVAIVQAMLPQNLGMALGLMNGVAFGLGSAAVALAGFVVANYGAATTLQAAGAVPLLAALAYVAVTRRVERKAASASS